MSDNEIKNIIKRASILNFFTIMFTLKIDTFFIIFINVAPGDEKKRDVDDNNGYPNLLAHQS